MLQIVRKHIKPILFCLCGMLILYILMPMCFLRTLPFHVVHLDAEKVTAIEIYRCNEKKEIVQSIRIEDADEISELVQQLNDARFWHISDELQLVRNILVGKKKPPAKLVEVKA